MTRRGWITLSLLGLLSVTGALLLRRGPQAQPLLLAQSGAPPSRLTEPKVSADETALDRAPGSVVLVPESVEKRQAVDGETVHVRGQVVFPPDTPSDERVELVANGQSQEELLGSVGPVALGADGTFDILVPKAWEDVVLELRAHWIYSQQQEETRAATGDFHVELHTNLGAQVEVELQPPVGLTGAELLAAVGAAGLHDESDMVPIGEWQSVQLSTRSHLLFEAVPAEQAARLYTALRTLAYADVKLPPLVPGQRVRITIPLARGATITGDVVTSDGRPVVDASVRIHSPDGSEGREGKSDADGRFELPGVGPGEQAVFAQHDNYQDQLVHVAAIEAGETRRGVRIVLAPFFVIEGLVLDAHDDPVAKADVLVQRPPWSAKPEPAQGREQALGDSTEPGSEQNRGWDEVVRTDEHGRFRCTGMTSGTWFITAIAAERAGHAVLLLDSKAGPVVNPRVVLRDAPSLFVLIEGETFPVLPDSKIQVLDQHGNDFGRREFKNRHTFGQSLAAEMKGVRFGPLPPGSYHIIATHKDGRVAEDRVTLSGTEPVQVNLKFEGGPK